MSAVAGCVEQYVRGSFGEMAAGDRKSFLPSEGWVRVVDGDIYECSVGPGQRRGTHKSFDCDATEAKGFRHANSKDSPATNEGPGHKTEVVTSCQRLSANRRTWEIDWKSVVIRESADQFASRLGPTVHIADVPDLRVFFPYGKACGSLYDYLENFFSSIRDAPKIPEAHILSISYCRTRGKSGYLFLIIYLEYRGLHQFPIRLKLQGFDGPATVSSGSWRKYDTPGERSTFTVAYVKDYLMELTDGTGGRRPSIVDLLALADLSTKWDHSREGYPATLFLALKNVFDGIVTSRSRATPLPSCLSAEATCAVVDAFPVLRQGMQKEIDFRRRRRCHPDETREIELLVDNAKLQSQVEFLEREVARLMPAVSVYNTLKAASSRAIVFTCCRSLTFSCTNDAFLATSLAFSSANAFFSTKSTRGIVQNAPNHPRSLAQRGCGVENRKTLQELHMHRVTMGASEALILNAVSVGREPYEPPRRLRDRRARPPVCRWLLQFGDFVAQFLQVTRWFNEGILWHLNNPIDGGTVISSTILDSTMHSLPAELRLKFICQHRLRIKLGRGDTDCGVRVKHMRIMVASSGRRAREPVRVRDKVAEKRLGYLIV
ncbi:hypothetical protein K438DRAFT_1763642 [Mycena galopus ATCC 62051]|nr:hypothetical protein K438DRAFT_1763642 [Mycena galopus ATCC 62051]